MCLSVLLVIRAIALRKGSQAADLAAPAPSAGFGVHAKAGGLFLLGFGYVLLLNSLGYAIAIAVLLFSVAFYSGAEFRSRTVLFALVGAGVAHLIFVVLFSVPMPEGHVLLWLFGT